MGTRKRVVIAGLGDTGVLVAIHLARRFEVVGISTKPGLVSGQELGLRLARPEEWARDYWVPFSRYRRLDGVRIVHGSVTGLSVDARTVHVLDAEGTRHDEPYDALVIATGVTNGFWRDPTLEAGSAVSASLAQTHDRLAAASSVMVIGGGAAAVSAAFNVASRWPSKQVDLYFPGERALVAHHPRVWDVYARRLSSMGVGLHPGHRASSVASGLSSGPVSWVTGQPPTDADVVLAALGQVRPNTAWLPASMLDDDGFVVVDEYLRVPGAPGVFAIGDVAASDPLRSSARARADGLVAHNVRAALDGGELKRFKPLRRRWGSIVGAQRNRLEVFSPSGRGFVIPAWEQVQPWVVQRAIYKGMRAGRNSVFAGGEVDPAGDLD